MIYERTSDGFCLPWGPSYITVDTEARIVSGDPVHVLVNQNGTGEVHTICKYIEATRDGRWWLQCLEGTLPIGGYFAPAAIHKIIGRQEIPGAVVTQTFQGAGADRATIKFWDEQSLDARAEWTTHGKIRDKEFPGMEAVMAEANAPWPEQFRLPPNYRLHGRGDR